MSTTTSIRLRRDFVLSQITDCFIRVEELYFQCCKLGYEMQRKAFSRDLIFLEHNKKIIRKVYIGGQFGTTSYVKLRRSK